MDFDSSYYNIDYYVTLNGKKFRKDGAECGWSYANPEGEWEGCAPICGVWKELFNPVNSLDVGSGRGTFVTYLRDIGIEAYGFDYSNWAIQNPYVRCQKGWCVQHDATVKWPYSNNSFDLVTALDIFEHIYLEDIDKVIDEMFRVTKKFIFLQIATVGGGSGSGIHDAGYILKRGENAPIELEAYAVAGHVTVQDKLFWVNRLMDGITRSSEKWKFRDDLISEFVKKIDSAIIDNWTKNTLLVLERV